MKLCREAGIGPGHIVLDGDPAPPKRGAQPPTFRHMSIVAKRAEAYVHVKWHLDPPSRLATIHGLKSWGLLYPLFGEGSWFLI